MSLENLLDILHASREAWTGPSSAWEANADIIQVMTHSLELKIAALKGWPASHLLLPFADNFGGKRAGSERLGPSLPRAASRKVAVARSEHEERVAFVQRTAMDRLHNLVLVS